MQQKQLADPEKNFPRITRNICRLPNAADYSKHKSQLVMIFPWFCLALLLLMGLSSAEGDESNRKLTEIQHRDERNRYRYLQSNPWHIGRLQGITASFRDGENPEIEVNYEIFNDKTGNVNVSLFEIDCSTAVVDGSLVVASQGVNGTVVASQTDLVVYQVLINVDEQNIYNSNLWTPQSPDSNFQGQIDFCIRTELVLENGSGVSEGVSFKETKITIEVAMTQDFTMLDIAANPFADDIETTAANVNYNVEACRCDLSNVCYGSVEQITMNSLLRLCIQSTSPEVIVENVMTLELKQDIDNDPNTASILIRTPVSSGSSDVLTELSTTPQGIVVVTTRLTSSFFSSDTPGAVDAVGAVRLLFSDGTRRLNIFSQANVAGMSSFQVHIPIQPVESEKKAAKAVGGTVAGSAILVIAMIVSIWYQRRKNASVSERRVGLPVLQSTSSTRRLSSVTECRYENEIGHVGSSLYQGTSMTFPAYKWESHEHSRNEKASKNPQLKEVHDGLHIPKPTCLCAYDEAKILLSQSDIT